MIPLIQQTNLPGSRDGLGTGLHSQLSIQIVNMPFHGALGDIQLYWIYKKLPQTWRYSPIRSSLLAPESGYPQGKMLTKREVKELYNAFV